MKYITNIYGRHKRVVIFISYFVVGMIIFPSATYIGWLWYFFGKGIMLGVSVLLSAWLAYQISKEGEW